MAKVFIEETTLTAIGDAIRGKEGTIELIPVPDMSTRIKAIETSTNNLPAFLSNQGTSLYEEDFKGVEYLRNYACAGGYFNNGKVSFPDTIKGYGSYCFYNAYINSLSDIKLSKGTDSINQSMFNKVQFNDKDIVIPEHITHIGVRAFADSNINSVALPDTLESIGEYAFSASSLTSITIPASVKSIGTYAFYNCDVLKTVVFEGSATVISNNAFNGCNGPIDIYVPWAEGAVAGAPWATTSSTDITVHYNSEV